jgi:hypothetical protein
VCVRTMNAVCQTRVTDMCRVVSRSRVLLQWRWLGLGEDTRDESEAQHTVPVQVSIVGPRRRVSCRKVR